MVFFLPPHLHTTNQPHQIGPRIIASRSTTLCSFCLLWVVFGRKENILVIGGKGNRMMYEQQQQQQQLVRVDLRKEREREKEKKRERERSIEEQRLQIVDLSGMSLDTLPKPSLSLAAICKLDLSNNNLQSIPESLTARLLNVVILDVHSNQLKFLPNSIGCLSKLKVLNISGNLIHTLPKTIENCRSLEELNANFNQLMKLPETLGFELLNMKKLSVNSNKLVFLPRSICHLTSLRVLDARLNCLRGLPEDMENLINLQVLNVSQNFQYLETLPYCIGLLMSLVELDVSYNRIKALPDSMGCLKKLQKLCVEGNPLVSPPMEVVELGLYAVKEYLSEKMTAHRRSSPNKRSSWIGKLVRYRTFNGNNKYSSSREEKEGFIMSDYRSIETLATPRNIPLFSPKRLFSPRNYFFSK